jgi:HTH-type transcriptional regulator/antitoxin HigA
MEIHPIRNDDDLAAALREIEKLWGAADGTEEGDELDILSMLVEKYEDRSWPNIDISDPIDLLNYEIDELGHSQAELAELLGSRSRASELLNRRRPLTVEMIHRISEAWKIPADLLVRPRYPLLGITVTVLSIDSKPLAPESR